MKGLYCVVVDAVLKAANTGLFKVWWLFEGENWRYGEDLGEELISINNVMTAVKNMGMTKGTLSDVSRVCLLRKSLRFFAVACWEQAIDELSIISCSYEGVLQHLQVSVLFLLFRADPVY
eukprot:g13418.t1